MAKAKTGKKPLGKGFLTKRKGYDNIVGLLDFAKIPIRGHRGRRRE